MKKHIHVLQPDSRRFITFLESPQIKERFFVTRGDSIPFQCDAVFCQTYTDPSMLNALLETDKTIILHFNGDPFYELEHVQKDCKLLKRVIQVCEKTAGVICLSRFLAERGKQSVPNTKFLYLPRGLWGVRHTPIGVMPQLYRQKKIFNTKEPLVVMQINLSHPLKYSGVPLFFEAIKRCVLGARFLNVGNINGNEALAKKWEHDFSLTFKTPGSHWPETLLEADIYVQPSLFDTWGRSVADAMCCGLPILAFDYGGIPNVSRDIILCNPESQSDISNKFEALLNHPEDWPGIGEKLHKEAWKLDEKHRWDYHDLVCCILNEPMSPESNIKL